MDTGGNVKLQFDPKGECSSSLFSLLLIILQLHYNYNDKYVI